MNRIAILVAVLLAITLLVLWAASSAHGPDTTAGSARFVSNAVMLSLLTASLVLNWRGTASDAVRYAAIWLTVFVGLIFAYSYRSDVSALYQRFSGELNPALPIATSGNVMSLRRASDGHFYADVVVNGVTMRMLADTGASTVALNVDDARRAGISTAQLQFDMQVTTANGTAPAAEIILDELRVGLIIRHKVRATVSRDLGQPLLGMSFFNTLSRFQIENDELQLQD